MLIPLERYGIFGPNFVYLCILTLSSHWYEKGDEASSSIILAGRALLVKMLITPEPRYAFCSHFDFFFFFPYSSFFYFLSFLLFIYFFIFYIFFLFFFAFLLG